MKTIIEWFWNLGWIVNITPANFWWIVAIIAIPVIVMLCLSFKKQHSAFWTIASMVYAVFAISWALNLGWNMRENQYEKTKSIESLTNELLELTTKDIHNHVQNVDSVMTHEIDAIEGSIDSFFEHQNTDTVIPVDTTVHSHDTIKVKLKDNSILSFVVL